MKQILLFLILNLSILNAEQLDSLFNPKLYPKFNYISFGLIDNANTDNYDFDIGFLLEMGVKINNHKIYINFQALPFSNKTNDLDLNIGSINYDYNYYNNNGFKPYIGIGLDYIDILNTDLETKKDKEYTKIGANIKTGFIYKLNSNWDIDFGVNYLYINHELIKNTYGGAIDIEYNF